MAISKPAKKYAPTTWGKEFLVDLEVPSGQTCQVRRPGVPGLIKAGILDSLDSLSQIVQADHIDRVKSGGDVKKMAADVQGAISDVSQVEEIIDLMDKVVEFVVVQPHVIRPICLDSNGKPLLSPAFDRKTGEPLMESDGVTNVMRPTPLRDDERAPGQIYTDQIDLSDKIFIFQYVVGGVSDLEQFRQEFGETLGGMESGSGVSGAA